MKWLKKGAVFTLILGLTALSYLIYKDSTLNSNIPSVDRVIEIKGSTITGYQNGRLSFRIPIGYIWASRSKYLFQAEKIDSGEIFDINGEPIVNQLFSGSIRVNTRSKSLTAYNGVRSTFLKREEGQEQVDSIQVSANELRYFDEVQKTYLYGNIAIIQKESTVRPAETVEIAHQSNQVYINNGYRLESDTFKVTGNQLIMNLDENFSELSGGVEAVRLPKKKADKDLDTRERNLQQEKTELWCDALSYNTKGENKVITIKGNAVIFQEDKEIRAEHGYYNKNDNYFEVEDRVNIIARNLLWLINGDPESYKNKEIREALHMRVEVNADKVMFDADKKILTMVGNVYIKQPDKDVSCDKFIYDDETGWLTLIGHVVILKKEGEKKVNKMETEFIKMNIKNEEMEAKDGVETQFKIQLKDRVSK